MFLNLYFANLISIVCFVALYFFTFDVIIKSRNMMRRYV